MRHHHGQDAARPEGPHEHSGRHRRHGHGHGPGPRRRLFDYGELRLLILAMIEREPRHGYQIIKAIEERFEGRYTPSPGVVYPTLAWLEDMGYAVMEPGPGGRKETRITAEGLAFLTANRAAAEELLNRPPPCRPRDIPPEIEAAMEALKAALRSRRGAGPEATGAMARAIEAAAEAIRAAVPEDEA